MDRITVLFQSGMASSSRKNASGSQKKAMYLIFSVNSFLFLFYFYLVDSRASHYENVDLLGQDFVEKLGDVLTVNYKLGTLKIEKSPY